MVEEGAGSKLTQELNGKKLLKERYNLEVIQNSTPINNVS